MLFTPATRSAADEWRALAAFDTLFLDQDTGTILDVQGTRMGCVVRVGSKEELRAAEATAATASGYVVMDASDWKVRGSCIDRTCMQASACAGLHST